MIVADAEVGVPPTVGYQGLGKLPGKLFGAVVLGSELD
jgi:hypothetical protein